MKSGTQVALAIGVGYLLGRRRKMRLALMLGGAAMAGGLGGLPGQLVRRGSESLGSADVLGKVSPELGEVTKMISGELLPVVKAAAQAAVSGRVNALSDRVHERAEALRSAQAAGEEEAAGQQEAAGEEEEVPSGRGRRRQRFGDEEEYEAGHAEAPEPRMARAGRGPAGAASQADGYVGRRDRAEDEEEDEDMPLRAAGSRAGAPVRRTRR